jgi:hypothetical protein
MHVVIVGGHPRTALPLGSLLTADGHEATGTVRDLEQIAELSSAGMRSAVVGLEQATPDDLVRLLTGPPRGHSTRPASTRLRDAIDGDRRFAAWTPTVVPRHDGW